MVISVPPATPPGDKLRSVKLRSEYFMRNNEIKLKLICYEIKQT